MALPKTTKLRTGCVLLTVVIAIKSNWTLQVGTMNVSQACEKLQLGVDVRKKADEFYLKIQV
jgi:hypothetical protein